VPRSPTSPSGVWISEETLLLTFDAKFLLALSLSDVKILILLSCPFISYRKDEREREREREGEKKFKKSFISTDHVNNRNALSKCISINISKGYLVPLERKSQIEDLVLQSSILKIS